MEATIDIWEIPPESASRVGHPLRSPWRCPERLIDLFTYRGDLVLDPFIGSGSTPSPRRRTGRRFAGYDLDPAYVELAGTAGARLSLLGGSRPSPPPAGGRPSFPPR